MSNVAFGPVVVIDSISEKPDDDGSRKRMQSDSDDNTDSKKSPNYRSLVLDGLGDLTLRVGPEKSTFKVCSRTVARASPVFMRMLHGQFKESRPESSDWIVDLPDDDAEFMQIMLSMMHARFDWVPQRMVIEDLYGMLVLVDKYDALDVVRPWARGWVEAVSEDLNEPALLWIASELGDSLLFGKVMTEIASKWTINLDDDIIPRPPTPPGLLQRRTRKTEKSKPLWIPEHGYQKRTSPVTLDFMKSLRATEVAEIIDQTRKELLTMELQPYWSVIHGIHRRSYEKKFESGPDTIAEEFLDYSHKHYDCGASMLFRLLGWFDTTPSGIHFHLAADCKAQVSLTTIERQLQN